MTAPAATPSVVAAVLLLCGCSVLSGSPRTVPAPMATASAPADSCGAPANRWGFTFCPGAPVTNPPNDFCSSFPCVPDFFSGGGYTVECADGQYSNTGGQADACAGHGGVIHTLAEPGRKSG